MNKNYVALRKESMMKLKSISLFMCVVLLLAPLSLMLFADNFTIDQPDSSIPTRILDESFELYSDGASPFGGWILCYQPPGITLLVYRSFATYAVSGTNCLWLHDPISGNPGGSTQAYRYFNRMRKCVASWWMKVENYGDEFCIELCCINENGWYLPCAEVGFKTHSGWGFAHGDGGKLFGPEPEPNTWYKFLAFVDTITQTYVISVLDSQGNELGSTGPQPFVQTTPYINAFNVKSSGIGTCDGYIDDIVVSGM